MSEAWQAVSDRSFVVDGHDDLMIDVVQRRLKGERNVIQRVHLPKMRQGGVDLKLLMVGGDHSTMFYGADHPGWAFGALRCMDELYQEQQESGGEFVIALTWADIQRAREEGKIAFVLHFEGGRPLEGHLGFLRQFFRLGLRSIGLVWFLRNALADSCAERKPAGLSYFGAAVVQEAERLGMLVDIAHLSEPGSLEVLELARGPVVATHANARAVQQHPRNLSDEVIRKLAAKGGVMGLVAFPPFISQSRDRPTLDDMVDHADHIRRLVGIEHVGLGLDFTDFAPEAFASYHASVSRAIGLDLGHAEMKFPEGLEDTSGIPNLTRALLRRGFSEADVQALLGGNFLRVLEQVLSPKSAEVART